MTYQTPKGMPTDIADAFDGIVSVLTSSGVIGSIEDSDLYGIEIVAIQIVRMREAQRGIAQDGLYYQQTNRDGMPYGAVIQHPGVGIEHKAAMIIKQWSEKLGLAPADRAKLAVLDTSGGDDLNLD